MVVPVRMVERCFGAVLLCACVLLRGELGYFLAEKNDMVVESTFFAEHVEPQNHEQRGLHERGVVVLLVDVL